MSLRDEIVQNKTKQSLYKQCIGQIVLQAPRVHKKWRESPGQVWEGEWQGRWRCIYKARLAALPRRMWGRPAAGRILSSRKSSRSASGHWGIGLGNKRYQISQSQRGKALGRFADPSLPCWMESGCSNSIQRHGSRKRAAALKGLGDPDISRQELVTQQQIRGLNFALVLYVFDVTETKADGQLLKWWV